MKSRKLKQKRKRRLKIQVLLPVRALILGTLHLQRIVTVHSAAEQPEILQQAERFLHQDILWQWRECRLEPSS